MVFALGATHDTSEYSHLPVLRRLAYKRFSLANLRGSSANCIEIDKGARVPSQHKKILFSSNATVGVFWSRLGSVRRIVKFPESKCNLLFEEAIKFYHIHTQTVLQFLHLLRLIVKTLEMVQHTRLYFRPIQLYMFWQSESQLQWITTKPFPQHLNFKTIWCGGYRKLISERDFIGKKIVHPEH